MTNDDIIKGMSEPPTPREAVVRVSLEQTLQLPFALPKKPQALLNAEAAAVGARDMLMAIRFDARQAHETEEQRRESNDAVVEWENRYRISLKNVVSKQREWNPTFLADAGPMVDQIRDDLSTATWMLSVAFARAIVIANFALDNGVSVPPYIQTNRDPATKAMVVTVDFEDYPVELKFFDGELEPHPRVSVVTNTHIGGVQKMVKSEVKGPFPFGTDRGGPTKSEESDIALPHGWPALPECVAAEIDHAVPRSPASGSFGAVTGRAEGTHTPPGNRAAVPSVTAHAEGIHIPPTR